MTALQAAWLGVVQGLTEFLPISSSAHLILARAFFGWDAGRFGLAFDVACHVGTLLAVLIFFRHEIGAMIAAAPGAVRGETSDPARLARSVAIGTLPVVVAGLLFAGPLSTTVRTAEVAGMTLALGALVMIAAERYGKRTRGEVSLTGLEALGLGVAQAAALVPGVSRSGAVLTVAMLFGLRRDRAARFSFLLGVPAILAAAGAEGLDLVSEGVPEGMIVPLVVGLGMSALVGYATVTYFIRYLARRSLHLFAVYRLVLAAAVLVWLATSS